MKILTVTLAFLTVFCMPSCKKTNPYENKTSQLRETSLFYDCNDYCVTAFPEICENPIEYDGVSCNLEKVISFKLQIKNQNACLENCQLEFEIEGEIYNASFEFSPLSSFLYCKTAVENLPTDELYLKLIFNNQSVGVNLLSQRNESTTPHIKILNSLKETDEFVKSFLDGETGELKIRFIDNDGYDYWYIGFINENETTAYLVDGETGEVLAKKQEK